ncbi:peptidoglycan-binding domain-containing protein [Sorangium sp. So ce1504]|uniref:peptidoglycan-binding domain-containing protein n=1 Tax=Sorangium sp. So ce1504 TaxID=3133337 RepID=UPI003F6050F3
MSRNVFLFEIAAARGDAEEVERALLSRTSAFALGDFPTLDPALFAHRILRGKGASYTWEIGLDEIEEARRGELHAALLEQIQTSLAGVAELRSSAAYADLSLPAPGLDPARARGGRGGALSFADGDLPVWEDHARGSGAVEAGSALPEDLTAEIAQSRAAVPVEPGLKPWGAGHVYTGSADKDHLAYLHRYLDARAAKASPADRRKILAFRAFQAREGSTAAINTYDNQIVTWGTGWGGRGWLGKVMERATANDAVREALGAAGVRYRGSNVYDVVDLDSGMVVTGGKEALEILRRSVPLLHRLIDLARNPATRDAVTEAQLRTFMDGSGNICGADAIATQALFNLIAHLKHWAPGYVIGCLEWAVPQLGPGSPSEERDRRLAALVGRYFYGKARKHRWIPDFRQFRLYFQHLKDDGLDCLHEPFLQAAGPPADDPFAAAADAPAAAPPPEAPSPPKDPRLTRAPLAGQPDLESVASGRGALRRGARGPGVKALQEALIALGESVPGGADGAFGPGLEAAVKQFQAERGLAADGVIGAATLAALDAAFVAGAATRAAGAETSNRTEEEEHR